jgi:hypothetical protein
VLHVKQTNETAVYRVMATLQLVSIQSWKSLKSVAGAVRDTGRSWGRLCLRHVPTLFVAGGGVRFKLQKLLFRPENDTLITSAV